MSRETMQLKNGDKEVANEIAEMLTEAVLVTCESMMRLINNVIELSYQQAAIFAINNKESGSIDSIRKRLTHLYHLKERVQDLYKCARWGECHKSDPLNTSNVEVKHDE